MRCAKTVSFEEHPGPWALSTVALGRWVSVFALMSGCGDDPPPPPPEPPEIAVEGLDAIGGGRWSPGQDEPLSLGCDYHLVLVELGPGDRADEVDQWTLRPPGTCGGEQRCGFLSLTLEPDTQAPITVDAASSTVEMTLPGPGSYRLAVEFRKDDGSSPGLDGQPVTVEIDFEAAHPPDSECLGS